MQLLLQMIPFYIEALDKYISSNQTGPISKFFLGREVELSLAKQTAAKELIEELKAILTTGSLGLEGSNNEAQEQTITPPISSLANLNGTPLLSPSIEDDGIYSHVSGIISKAIVSCDDIRERFNHSKGSYDELLQIIRTNIDCVKRNSEMLKANKAELFIDDYSNELAIKILAYKCCLEFDREIYFNGHLNTYKKSLFFCKTGEHLQVNHSLIQDNMSNMMNIFHSANYRLQLNGRLSTGAAAQQVTLQYIKLYSEYSRFLEQLRSFKEVDSRFIEPLKIDLKCIIDEFKNRFEVQDVDFLALVNKYTEKQRNYLFRTYDGFLREDSFTPYIPTLSPKL